MQLTSLLESTIKDEQLLHLSKKVINEKRLSPAEGLYLYKHAELSLLALLANFIRERKHGNKTYFNKNFHSFLPFTYTLFTGTHRPNIAIGGLAIEAHVAVV
jgi:hypothetical protein